MNSDIKLKIENLLKIVKELDKDNKVIFISIYGSSLTEKYNALSDIDVAVYYNGTKKERFKFRIQLFGKLSDKFDVHIFQDVPLYIRSEIIKTGEIIYTSDFTETSFIYSRVAREFSSFEKYLNHYYSVLRTGALE